MKKLLLLIAWTLLLVGTAFPLQVNVTWNAVTTYTDGSAISGATVYYDVYRATVSSLTDGVKLNATSVTVLTYSDTTAQSGKTYYYYCKSLVSGQTSTNSNVVTVTTTPLVPSAPSGVQATVQ